MKLFVVVLCYRVPDLTIDCLKSLCDEIERIPGTTKVGVCENGTGGDAAERIRRAIDDNDWGSWCKLTVVFPNRGFCGGNNTLIREALASSDPPEYVLLLNADTIIHPNALETLVRFMDEQPAAGIAGSQLLAPHGQVQASPFRFPGILSELDLGLKLGPVSRLLQPWATTMPIPTTTSRGDWVAGASMILRRSMLEQIGLLDEDLYTYFDDIDICLRAKRAGWETWYVPASKVVHLEGASTGVATGLVKRRPAYWFQARRRFFLKSYGKVYTALVDAAFLLGFAAQRLRLRLSGKPDRDPPHMLQDSFRHSVFRTGFRLRAVENPAIREAQIGLQESMLGPTPAAGATGR